MSDETTSLLDKVIADYLRVEENGQPVDREQLFAEHPELAAELKQFFEDRDGLSGMAPPIFWPRRTPLTTIRYFGDYELLEEVACGGMGIVYKARQQSLNRTVAVKMILAGKLATSNDEKRFQAEAEAAAGLEHEAIVPIYEVGRHDGQHFFSMRYVEGRSLAELVRENPLPARRAAEYVKQTAEAIHYAHQHGTLHRDLKPSNILVDADDRIQVTDFGLAMRVEAESDLTRTGQVLGTPSYMAPEQAQGKRGLVGPTSDVYSLGVVLYELMVGRPPFRAETAVETLRQVIETEPASPRLLNPQVPRDLETICLKCLQKEPHNRYGTAGLLAEDIGRSLRGQPISARPIGHVGRGLRWCRRNPVVTGLTSGVAALLIATVGTLAVSHVQIKAALSDREHALAEKDFALDEALENENRARAEAAKAGAISDLLQEMLGSGNPESANGADYTVRELLDQFSRGLDGELQEQPEVEATLRATIGNAFRLLRLMDEAEPHLHRALELRRQAFGSEHPAVAQSLLDYGWNVYERERYSEAEVYAREALAIFRKNGSQMRAMIQTLLALQHFVQHQADYDEGERVAREVLALAETKPEEYGEEIATAYHLLAHAKLRQGKYEEVEGLARQAVEMRRRLYAPEHPKIAWTTYYLGCAHRGQKNYKEADACFREALAIFQNHFDDSHNSVIYCRTGIRSIAHRLQETKPIDVQKPPTRIEAHSGDMGES